MGSCVSVHSKGGRPESTGMKLGVAVINPESPIKPNINNTNNQKQFNGHAPVKSFDDFGSKDETFFDSRAWLDSDCEDDFYSVNGDFTPSRGNTPVHHNFSAGTPKINKTAMEGKPIIPGSKPEPSPTGKKRLSELFRESLRDNNADNVDSSSTQNVANGKTEAKQTILDVLPKSASGTPYVSGSNSVCSSDRTANGDALFEKEKPIKSVQCCLPSLISCRSFSDRKKKMSPAIAVNDEA